MCVKATFKISLLTLVMATAGCASTMPTLGGGSGHTITGGAGGSNAEGQNTSLEKCETPLGTLSLYEDTQTDWWDYYRSSYPNLGSTVPVIRTMIQQSNCFVVVERGQSMAAMTKERELMNSGALRGGSNFGQGQMVAADYTVSPSIQFSAKDTGGIGGLVGGWVGAIAGGLKSNEAATTLLLIDNRSGVQVSSSVGNAKNWDYGIFGGLFAGGFFGAGGYTKTPEGKVITAAFADSYNNMVKALRNYKAQNVEGGLGKGGKLTVN